jgi:hypothetical protein
MYNADLRLPDRPGESRIVVTLRPITVRRDGQTLGLGVV